MKSENEGSTISKEVKVDVREYPILQWRWKAVALPKGGDSRKKDTDDQGAQIYVELLGSRPRCDRARSATCGTARRRPRTIVKSEKSGTVTYVIMRSGPAELGKWITETRNVLEDYRKIYNDGDPTDPAGALSVAIDSNDTKSSAESFMGEILFKKP